MSDPILIQVGHHNYFNAEKLVGILDINIPAIKRILKDAKESRPHHVFDTTRGKKANSLIVFEGDRYVVSIKHRHQLAKSLGIINSHEIELVPEEETSKAKNLKGVKRTLDGKSSRTRTKPTKGE